jgi:hypothetical protein
MITRGQANFWHAHVNSYLGLLLVASVAGWFGLMIWQSAFNQNPVADAMAKAFYANQALTKQLQN